MQVPGLRKANQALWRQTSGNDANMWGISLVGKIDYPLIELLNTQKYVLLYYLNKQTLKVFSNIALWEIENMGCTPFK